MSKDFPEINGEHLRPRLERRLQEMGQTARGVCRAAGLGESTLRNLLEGRSKSPRLTTMVRLADALQVGIDWFFESTVREIIHSQGLIRISPPVVWLGERPSVENQYEINQLIWLSFPRMSKDGLYILKTSQGFFSANPLFKKTSNLRQFAMIVRDDSMWPAIRRDDQIFLQLEEGDLALGEDYLFFNSDLSEGDTFCARLGRLLNKVGDELTVSIFHPEPQTFSLDRGVWPNAYRVVTRIAL